MSRTGWRRLVRATRPLTLGLRLSLALPFGLAGALATGASQAAPSSPLDVLFAQLARSPGLFARFHEEKQIALLVAPLKSDGTVHFDRAKGLARHTLTPSKRSILLNAGTLTVWDGTKTEVIPLSSQPSLRAFAEAFTMFLAADRVGLEKTFKLDFSGDPQASWRMKLVPVSADLKKMVTELEVAGQGTALSTLRVTEASGDVSTTTFSDVDTARQYTPAEQAAIFSVPGSASPPPAPPTPAPRP